MNPIAEQIATLFTSPTKTKQLKTPGDYGLNFEKLTIPSKDGVSLAAWYVPNKGNKLAVMNHPLYCSKYGFIPEGVTAQFVPVHVQFLPLLKNLFEDGYSIISIDYRNHGESEEGTEKLAGIGAFEWKDIVGVMNYINNDTDLQKKDIAMISQCMGSNATMRAMSTEPEAFKNVKVMTGIQAISMKYMAEKMIPMLGGNTTLDEIDEALQEKAGITLADMSPFPFINDITVPTFFAQVRKDILTSPEDTQNIYDSALVEKELLWIEGDLNRFDGYNYFNDVEHYQTLKKFLDKYIY